MSAETPLKQNTEPFADIQNPKSRALLLQMMLLYKQKNL
jgi:hypothetical protein